MQHSKHKNHQTIYYYVEYLLKYVKQWLEKGYRNQVLGITTNIEYCWRTTINLDRLKVDILYRRETADFEQKVLLKK